MCVCVCIYIYKTIVYTHTHNMLHKHMGSSLLEEFFEGFVRRVGHLWMPLTAACARVRDIICAAAKM